tara:strand:+ start:1408 stop:1707 length:300 start_codon:yes stop_codon:yes gene_type:complete
MLSFKKTGLGNSSSAENPRSVPFAASANGRYIPDMEPVLIILLIIAMVLVLGTLFSGLISMVRGGAQGPRRSNMFMRYRVLFQGLALLILIILFAFAKN